jgi:ABC-2 type transport system permease protein
MALTLAGVVVTFGTLAVSVPVGVTVIESRGGNAILGTRLLATIGAALLVMAAYAVIGVAVGALVRNQIIAVVGVLVWMLVVEQIVVPRYPAVGRWLPGGATYAWLQLAPALRLNDALLPPRAAGWLLLGYTVAAVLLGWMLSPRRDVP